MPIDLSGNRILYSGITSMGVFEKKITRDGLVLELDAGDINSYPGSGAMWYDLSGNGHNFLHGGSMTWNSGGYWECGGGAFTGPPSNLTSWGFNTSSESYIEAYVQQTTLSVNQFTRWNATPNTNSDYRTLATHLGYDGFGATFYDMNGCCDAVQRINVGINGLTSGINCISFQTRKTGYPNRQIFKNLISQVDSGTNNTATVTWDSSLTATIANGWLGKLYVLRVYNRPLHPYEMAENFQATRGRFGI